MSNIIYPQTKHQRFDNPLWTENAVLYEVNIRQYTSEGTISAFRSHIPRLKAMGVDILWLMPIFPIGQERKKGSLGSYYSVADYTKVNPEFGTMEDLVSLVDYAHSVGMHVILDWVANHSSRDNVWIKDHKSWYEWDYDKNEILTPWDWTDTAKLNYSSQEMRQEMINSLLFWLREAKVDGFRFDMAMLVPDDFWYTALDALHNEKPDIFLLAESEGENFHKLGFHATYGWNIHHMMVDIASGRKNAWDLVSAIRDEAMEYPIQAMRMRFTSNHDEDSHQGCAAERFGSALQASSVLTYVLPGIPLIYSGEETCNSKRLSFFDKDEIIWYHTPLAHLYAELSELRHTVSALQNGDLFTIQSSSSSPFLLSLKRKSPDSVVIALFNFSGQDIWTNFYDEDFNGSFNQLGSSENAILKSGKEFYLSPWGYFLYYKQYK